MNIFYLSEEPKQAAIYHLDKHVVKMILESAQLLCTAHRIIDGNLTVVQKTTSTGKIRNVKHHQLFDPHLENLLYNATHANHPCAIWARSNINNYMWLYNLFICLCDEYTFRYKKTHKTDLLLRDVLRNPPVNISHDSFSTPAQAMPKQYRCSDPVQAYRNYYVGAKKSFAKWTHRPIPEWFVDKQETHANV